MKRLGSVTLVLLWWCSLASVAQAHVTRFALLLGNDHGSASEPNLEYAQRDAERVYQVLRDVGGFDPVNMVLLRGERAATVEQTLVTLNARIRTLLEAPGQEALLFVYYSGHADGEALELEGTRLAIQRIAELVRGSAATFRILVLDACRSGTLTRSKGGHIAPPFPLESDSPLPGQGMAFLTASALNEDAQESDAISGSFFTHALVSGMLGAADSDADGVVALEEVYAYAYDATLRATSRSLAGAQHPTFSYDLRGQGKLALTRPFERAERRAWLSFPAGRSYLVTRDDAHGAVVAEVSAVARGRTLSLREGRYYVIGRADDHLLEGAVQLAMGEQLSVEDAQLRRVEHARFVRKGSAQPLSQGLLIGYSVRSALPNAATACHGPLLGYSFDMRELSVRTRVHACRSQLEHGVVRASVDELGLELRAVRAFDVGPFTFGIGVAGLYGVFWQRFEPSARTTHNRLSSLYGLSIALEVEAALSGGFFMMLDIEPSAYVFSLVVRESHDQLRSAFALRTGLSLGMRY